MGTRRYLAMTAAEFAAAPSLSENIGWMACHFSPYDTGLCNLPGSLPPGSLLIVNDRIPLRGHDAGRISEQLHQALEALCCGAVLLDFQQASDEARAMADHLVSTLPCPVAVSEDCGQELNCPLFLSPCPHHTHLKEYISPRAGRELWLDLARDAQTLTLTKEGCRCYPLPLGEIPPEGYHDDRLCCHYRAETGDDFARFTLWRTQADLEDLAREADGLGIRTFVGLWQEWR